MSDNGEISAIGAIFNDGNGNMSGHARIHQISEGYWQQVSQDIDGEAVMDNFGEGVSLSSDGNTVAIGSRSNSNANGLQAGHVRVYDLNYILSTPENNSTTFTLFPNPTSTKATIQLQNDDILEKVTEYNNVGQLVMTSTEATIDT